MSRLLTLLIVLAGSQTVSAAAPEPSPLPITGLSPSKIHPNLCVYHYSVGTTSPECQAHCDQGFGYFYSYVWMEAARSFETALQHDPDCALAWLGLYRALDKWGKGGSPAAAPFLAIAGASWQGKLPGKFRAKATDYALEKAQAAMPRANHRAQLLVRAVLEEKGLLPNIKPEDRKKKATATLDELLTLYEDDQEGWFARAQIAEGTYGKAPFHKSLLKLNPVHPGSNHELVHFYENIRRPALGWRYAEGYMASSPGLPHAFHMQAHLAMRIGKWKQTTEWSARAYAMEKEYHRFLNVKPNDDHQFRHHMETLTRSLVHDGRFAEVDAVRREAEGYKYEFRPEWFRMALARHDWPDAHKLVEAYRKKDKTMAAYLGACLALEQGDTTRATAEVDVLRQAQQKKKTDKKAEQRLWEVQGRLLCQTGQGESGVKLFRRLIAKTKDDFAHHAWGGGALYMETWGVAALEAGLTAEADEAFQEALAHDTGSVRGALGMWALCQRVGRTAEAERYLKVAHRCWPYADPADFDRLQADLARKAENLPAPRIAGAATPGQVADPVTP